MKHAGPTACLLLLVSATPTWAANKPPKKFHTGSSHPLHSAQTGKEAHVRSGPDPVMVKSQSAHQSELARLEHQNVSQIHGQSMSSNSKTYAAASRVHSQPTGRSSGINFNYHPPRSQSTATTGGRKH